MYARVCMYVLTCTEDKLPTLTSHLSGRFGGSWKLSEICAFCGYALNFVECFVNVRCSLPTVQHMSTIDNL